MNSEVAELEQSWRTLFAAGNEAFNAHEDAAAQHYAAALAIAERLLSIAQWGAHACRLAPMVRTIACRNLVLREFRAGRNYKARGFLLTALRTLVLKIEASESSEALRTSCLRHLEHALAFLMEAAPDATEEPEAADLVKRVFTLRKEAKGAPDLKPSGYQPSNVRVY